MASIINIIYQVYRMAERDAQVVKERMENALRQTTNLSNKRKRPARFAEISQP
jgi:hypothetical protein